ncbi:DUF4865 family protein [Rhodanobacter sp. Col0626]|uniref:DUF4865 family protein n=1 Tax=Rhodanobacter sp. Col0626 TaxID=3415679 RepID=UPI003CEFA874
MIAMQYGFTLPADYDMTIIRNRIAEKGHLLDDFPHLRFKAYLYADRHDTRLPGRENLYAPFYLWRDGEGMNEFLGGAGFAALTQSFGWPSIRTWSVWQAELAADLSAATCATRDIIALPPYSTLDACRRAEAAAAHDDMDRGALAAVSAFEPTGWTLLRFRLWPKPRADFAHGDRQAYSVGHVSQPGAVR